MTISSALCLFLAISQSSNWPKSHTSGRITFQGADHDLLAAAYDHGFTHFDTAPYYGFGTAECDLKPLLAAHPNITVATKVGLYSPGGEGQLSATVFARKAVGRFFPRMSRAIADWSVERARASLAGSLKRLGRERIDLYLLHEPDLALLRTDEWLGWLESERDKIRYFGVAVNTQRLLGFIVEDNPLAPFIQTRDSIDRHEADILTQHGRPMQLTYGYISAALRAGSTDVGSVLAQALRRNTAGSVIVSTRVRKRLAQYTVISDAADADPALRSASDRS